MKSWLQFSLVVLAILVGSDCFAQAGTTTRVRDSSGLNMGDVRAEHYNGGKARIAVARFENKTANAGRWPFAITALWPENRGKQESRPQCPRSPWTGKNCASREP